MQVQPLRLSGAVLLGHRPTAYSEAAIGTIDPERFVIGGDLSTAEVQGKKRTFEDGLRVTK